MIKSLLLGIVLMTPLASYADCAELAGRLNQQFGNVAADPDKPGLFDCKALPFDPALTVVALANSRDPYSYDLTIAVVETSGETLVARLDQKSELYSDANYLREVTIDTARYALAKGVRAFGVRASNFHGGGVQFEGATLALYVLSNNAIKPVMGRIVMRRSNGNQEFRDCYRVDAVARTLKVGASSTFGHANLILMERSEATDVTESGGQCKEERSARTGRYLLRFDGQRYRAPPKLVKEVADMRS